MTFDCAVLIALIKRSFWTFPRVPTDANPVRPGTALMAVTTAEVVTADPPGSVAWYWMPLTRTMNWSFRPVVMLNGPAMLPSRVAGLLTAPGVPSADWKVVYPRYVSTVP